MSRRFSICVALAVGTASSVYLSGQAQPTFRTGVELVRMDVRVVDAAGRPITDLRQDEITIVEDGVTRPALYFQRITEPAESFVDAATKAVTAEVSTNDGFPRGHLYLLVFDQAHITAGNEQQVRLAAERFVRRHVRPSDRVALFAVPGPGPQIAFTADRSRVLAELERVRGSYTRVANTPYGNIPVFDAHRIAQGDERLTMETLKRLTTEGGGDVLGMTALAAVGGRGGGSGEDAAVAKRLLVENARTIVSQSDSESRQFLQRLADVIRGLGDIEGRKSVILFSEGFFQDNLTRELEAVAAAAAQTYAVFHAFDLNRRGMALEQSLPSLSPQGSEIQARVAPLGTLAVETDGTLVLDASGRSDEALTDIATREQSYYLVGFEPSEEAKARRGQYRRVSIRVSRPGARVSARTGYAVGAHATPADRQRAVAAVLGAPFVQQGLKVDYTTYLLKGQTPGQQRVVLSLTADLPVRSSPEDRADVIFVARDVRDGRVVATGTDVLPLPERPAAGRVTGAAAWRVQFMVPAGTYLMRAVVREPGGLSGSADRRLEIPSLDTPHVAVSDLVLGTSASTVPVRATAYLEDGLSGMLEAYARGADQLQDARLTITVRTPDGRSSVASYTTELPSAIADAGGFLIRAPFQVPLNDVTPGPYVVHATFSQRGRAIAERSRFVDVVSGTAGPVDRLSVSTPASAPEGPVAPKDIVEGQLGQAFLAELLQRSTGSPLAGAADDAVRGQWERAEAATSSGETFVALAIRGLARFVREDYKGAVAAWSAAQELEREHAVTAFFLGWAHDRAGDVRAALTSWRGAAHLDPLMVSAHLALAEGYLKLQQPALARQALRAGLEALPNSPELLAKLRAIDGG